MVSSRGQLGQIRFNMADSIDQLTVDRMVNALRGPQAPAQHQTPLPRPDPRGNTFNERLPPQLKYYNYMLQNTMSPEVVPTDPLLSHGDYAANADKSMEYVPSQVAESVFNPSMQMPLSYGAG